MQMGRKSLSLEERKYRQRANLYLYCGWSWTFNLHLSNKNSGSLVAKEIRVSPTILSPLPHGPLLYACLLLRGSTHTLLVDLGAEACFISEEVAQQMDLEMVFLPLLVPAWAHAWTLPWEYYTPVPARLHAAAWKPS